MTIVSYIFYGWANPLFVPLLMFSTVVDHVSAHAIHRWRGQPRARRALIAALCTNLALLGFFKYYNFGADNLTALAEWLNLPAFGLDSVLRVTLPLGISFTVFQSMSYVIDVYRGDAVPIRSFIDYACFASMYPQLVAGPIIRFSELADQLHFRTHTAAKFAHGIAFLSVGLAKKILLANPCGKVADLAFDAGSRAPLDAWYGAAAYAFQIYFDFSGYSDMAIGLGLMIGFVFAKNFDAPYRSQSITEFWRRWHISLSAWLRDYLYLPLGGSRKGPAVPTEPLHRDAARRTVARRRMDVRDLGCDPRNAAGNRADVRQVGDLPRHPGASAHRGHVWHRADHWVFFRAASVPDALRYLADMAGRGVPHPGAGLLSGIVYQPYCLGTFLVAAAVVWTAPQSWDWAWALTPRRAAVVAALLFLSVVALTTQAYNPFIYFIF